MNHSCYVLTLSLHYRNGHRIRQLLRSHSYWRAFPPPRSTSRYISISNYLVSGCHTCRLDDIRDVLDAEYMGLANSIPIAGSSSPDPVGWHSLRSGVAPLAHREGSWRGGQSNLLTKYHVDGRQDDPFVELEYREMKQVIEREMAIETKWKDLIATPGNRRRLLLIIMLGCFYQWSGNGLIS